MTHCLCLRVVLVGYSAILVVPWGWNISQLRVMVNYVKSLRTIPSAACSNCCDRSFSCPNYEYVDAKKSIIGQQVAALKLLRSQILWYVYEQNWNWLHGYIGRLQWVERVNNKFPVSDIRLIELLTNEGEIENDSSWVDRCKVLLTRGPPNSVFAGYGTDNLKGPKVPPGSPSINCNVVAMKVLYCGPLFQTWHAGISPILNILPGT